MLLFVVLFYVYPLKFLFTVLTEGYLGRDSNSFGSGLQMRQLMAMYGIGFAAVYLLSLPCTSMPGVSETFFN